MRMRVEVGWRRQSVVVVVTQVPTHVRVPSSTGAVLLLRGRRLLLQERRRMVQHQAVSAAVLVLRRRRPRRHPAAPRPAVRTSVTTNIYIKHTYTINIKLFSYVICVIHLFFIKLFTI